MKNHHWTLVVLLGAILAFSAGWVTSDGTGVEPGYFDKPEAGGYGAGAEGSAPQGVSEEFQEYYKDLTE